MEKPQQHADLLEQIACQTSFINQAVCLCCIWIEGWRGFNRLICFPLSLSATDSDSEEDEPHFYLASESAGRSQLSAPRHNHNLSLLSLTVIIGKGRLQARTDRKVSHVAAIVLQDPEFNERGAVRLDTKKYIFHPKSRGADLRREIWSCLP